MRTGYKTSSYRLLICWVENVNFSGLVKISSVGFVMMCCVWCKGEHSVPAWQRNLHAVCWVSAGRGHAGSQVGELPSSRLPVRSTEPLDFLSLLVNGSSKLAFFSYFRCFSLYLKRKKAISSEELDSHFCSLQVMFNTFYRASTTPGMELVG